MSSSRHVHFLGICGYAVSGAALIAKQLGYHVSGSDEFAYPPTTDILDNAGIPWVNEHTPANLDRFGVPDLVVVGNQVRQGNSEWAAAVERGLPIISEAEFYAELTRDRLRIAVCGTHGKTTTAALLSLMLDLAGMAPGFRLGATSRDFAISARLGEGQIFVFEGDEYTTAPWDRRAKFLHIHPIAACVTNLEHDHPDIYPTMDDYRRPFLELVSTMPGDGRLVLYGDDSECLGLRAQASCPVSVYGQNPASDWVMSGIDVAAQRFAVRPPGEPAITVELGVPGVHNMHNATAALALARFADAPLDACLEACRSFQGAARRFEVVGTVNGVTVVDDYGHHPTEVAVTVRAARARYPTSRLIVVNIPHTYSRTKEFLGQYRRVYTGADLVIVGPIEAARERHLPATVTAEDVADRARSTVEVGIVDSAEAAIELLLPMVKEGDVVLCIALGGFDQFAKRMVAALEAQRATV